jgi:hypothetical protein
MNCHFSPVKQATTELDMPLTPSQKSQEWITQFSRSNRRTNRHVMGNEFGESASPGSYLPLPAILDNKIANEKYA